MNQTPFTRLQEVAQEILRLIGAPADVPLRGVTFLPVDGEPITLPLFAPAPLSDTERAIVNAIRTAGAALQQKELAEAADLGIRTVQRDTPRMVERGILLKHPTLGFYVPGMS